MISGRFGPVKFEALQPGGTVSHPPSAVSSVVPSMAALIHVTEVG